MIARCRRLTALIVLLIASTPVSLVAAQSVSTADGRSLRVEPASGDYAVTVTHPAWTVGGTVGQRLTDVTTSKATDALGDCQMIQFRWQDGGPRTGSIRLYEQRPLVLFSVKFDQAVTGAPAPFPVLSKLPPMLMAFRYGEQEFMRPVQFNLAAGEKDEQYGGPIALFDDQANTMVVSPAANFMVAMLDGDMKRGIRSGLNRTLSGVPAGYEQKTLLAIRPGIGSAWAAWGRGLTDLHGKKRPANDADIGLKYLGFWTDNGAYYYYNYDVERGYANTILAIGDYCRQHGIPIHYMQLDSWFYPKTFDSFEASSANKPHARDPKIPAGSWNRYGGLMEFTGAPELFPDGIEAFTKKLGLPLIVHNRWIDPTSPYHKDYQISGVAAVDPKWWDKIAADISGWGVSTYEQDWNNWIYNKSPELSSTTYAGDAYMDGMASACAAHGLTMQYCMMLPRMMLQGGAKYPNLTSVRVSGDRLERHKWREFLYGSVIADALGVWPWTDVFQSRETPNILLATLSSGMVGISDKIGEENAGNIFRSVRKDGVIVKPDAPLLPTDATFIAEGSPAAESSKLPIVCVTHSGAGVDAAYYVFACTRDPKTQDNTPWTIDPQALGIAGKAVAYDYFANTATLIDARHPLEATLKNGDDFAYRVIVPVAVSGMALIGDPGLFVTRGRQRIAASSDDGHTLRASVIFAAGESAVSLMVYAPKQPNVQVKNGEAGDVKWDAQTRLATVKLTAAPAPAPLAAATTTVEVTITD